MDRRGFLKTLAAGTYSVALPAIPAVSAEPRYWAYRLHNIEMLPRENAFGQVLRGLATLVDRPDITSMWAFRYDPDTMSMETVEENLDTILRIKFEQVLADERCAA